MINGFDTDFVLVLDPSDPKIAAQIEKIVQNLASQKNFCLKIDFADLLDQLIKPKFKSLFYWLNCEFYITNHCRPNKFLQLNQWYLWLVLLPVFLMVSIPYHAVRKSRTHDEKPHLQVCFKLEFCPNTLLALHLYSANQRPIPGRYLEDSRKRQLYIERDCFASELTSLVCL